MNSDKETIKVRIKFEKYGLMKFIGHLDMMRFFQKLIRRSQIDITYSEGFHPHQLMTFANPLGVGLCSKAEYMDIVLNNAESSEKLVDALNAQSVEGVRILSARRLKADSGNAMASVDMADYKIELYDECYDADFDLSKLVNTFFDRDEVVVEKKTKKSVKSIDLKKSVHEFKCGKRDIFMKVNAGSSENIRPEMVLNAAFEYSGLSVPEFSYQITRLEQYDADGKTLEEAGEIF